MMRAPNDWTIREYKEHGMNETLHYLVHMPDPFVKQILCIMPYTEEKPTIAMTLRMGNSSSLMDSIVLEQV
jgi:hypothetical protein